MAVTGQQILDKFPMFVSHVGGALDLEAERPWSVEEPRRKGLCFIPQSRWLTPCWKAGVAVVIVDSKVKVPPSPPGCVLSTSRLSMMISLIIKEFFSSPNLLASQAHKDDVTPQVDLSAVVARGVQLGRGTVVGPYAVISHGVVTGERCHIGAHTYVGDRVCMGHDVFIEPHVTLRHDVVVGNFCRIRSQSTLGSDGCGYGQDSLGHYHFKPHYGRVILGDFVELGMGVQVDRGTFDDTVIGEGTQVGAHCHLAHNVSIGSYSLLLAGVMVAGSTHIGSRCLLGERTGVRDHIRMVDGVVCEKGSFVHCNITIPGRYMGHFLMPWRQALRAYALLARLPQLKKKWKTLF